MMKTFYTNTKKVLYGLLVSVLGLTTQAHAQGYETSVLPLNATWKYNDLGVFPGANWTQLSYNDSTWASGQGIFGYGEGDETTVLSFGPSASNKYIAYYFRTTFNIANLNDYKSYLVRLIRDDGAVVYINGVEAFRNKMPAGTITNTTLAAGGAVGGHQERLFYEFAVDTSLFIQGTNVIAVQVHQDAVTSSDLSFHLEIRASEYQKLVAPGAEWKYLDNGSNQGSAWIDTNFNDAAWASGKAVLGYNHTANQRRENTTISWGPTQNNKYPCTYFRHQFFIQDTALISNYLAMELFIDDGSVIYLNGTELNRVNMPNGNITFQTYANVTVNGTGQYQSFSVDKSRLRNGWNTLAASAHQVNATSSDLVFQIEFSEVAPPPPPGGGCTSNTIGCFTSVSPNCFAPTLIIPETHTFQYIMAQNDPYTIGGGNMAGNHDFTAYVAKNGSSKDGWLSINHENTVGSVSILDLHFDVHTGLWVVDSSAAVDFSDVVGTNRNCSGGITPWGTVVTSEETMTGGDANNDGYTDVGWHVEIDPITRKVVDYDNDGFGDKLWAMGRSNKENICFMSDSVTAYFGNDESNNGFMYKFVANTPGNLSSGTLYVLVKPSLLSPNGIWEIVPNNTQANRNNQQSISSSLGARNFVRVEDVEIGPDGKIYFAATTSGRVYRFDDDGPTISNFEIFVESTSYTFNDGNGAAQAVFNWVDNLAFDNEGNLWVNADGGCSYIWMIRPNHTAQNPQIELFGRVPNGAESTGLTFTPDGKFGFLSIQHPNTGNNAVQIDAAGNPVIFNRSTTIVIARKSELGKEAAIPRVDLGENITVCEGAPVILNAGSNQNAYAWSTGQTTQSIQVSTSGTYTVTVTGSNGKTNVDSIQVSFTALPQPSINGLQFVYTDQDSAVQLVGIPAGGTFSGPGVVGNTFDPQTAGVGGPYVIRYDYTDAETGCSNYTFEVTSVNSTVGFGKNSAAAFNINVYPNPMQNASTVAFQLEKADEIEFSIVDIKGSVVYTRKLGRVAAGRNSFEIQKNEMQLQAGTYFVRMTGNEQNAIVRLIVQ